MSILLAPGDSYTFDVLTDDVCGRILGIYDVYSAPGQNYESFMMTDTWDHTVVPEPSSIISLLGGGLVGLMGMRRRRT